MVLRHDQSELIRAKTLVTQIWRVVGQKTQANIHAAFFECRLDLSGRDFFDRDADRRMIRDKCAEKLRDQWHIQHRNHTKAQCAAQFSGFTVQFVEKILQLMKERSGVLLKNQTSWSKQNPSPTALEERHAKSRFQIPHLLGNARLQNPEPVSRTAKASRLGNGKKIPEMANVQWLR